MDHWTRSLAFFLYHEAIPLPGLDVPGYFYPIPCNRGRAYYTGPAYVVLLVAGLVWLKNWLIGKSEKINRIGTSLLWGLLSLGAIIGLVLIKPIAPINSPLWKITSDINGEVNEMIGWQDLTVQVAGIYQSIPENEKPHTVILAANYGEAGALEMYGGKYGLPTVISGSNSMWARGYGEVEPQTVIVVGFEKDYAGKYFKECDLVDNVKNQYGVKNEETTYHTGLYICRQPRYPWKDMWSSMQWFQ